MSRLQVRRIAYALGAEVRGVDLRKPVDDATLAEIRTAWREHLLLCFPGQDISKPELMTFVRRFGEPERVRDNNDPDVPGLLLLTNKPVNGKPWDGYKNGPAWHSDRSYNPQPTGLIFINCKEIPEVGGDTMFANMHMAYDTLSPKLQEILGPMWAIHDRSIGIVPSGMKLLNPKLAAKSAITSAHRGSDQPLCAQPVIRVHADTGKKSLYLTERAREFKGMTREESKPLIDYLNEHSVRYEFTYRHRWKVGDLVVWDNRCMLHKALCDYDSGERHPRYEPHLDCRRTDGLLVRSRDRRRAQDRAAEAGSTSRLTRNTEFKERTPMSEERFKEGLAIRREVLGAEHVDRTMSTLTDFNREWQHFMTEFAWGGIWTRPGLDRKTRSMLTIAMLVAQNKWPEFRLHLRATRNTGVTRDEIKELLMQASVYASVPTAISAFHEAAAVYAEMDEKKA